MRYLLTIALMCWMSVSGAVEKTVTEIEITISDICVIDGQEVKTYVFDAKDDLDRVAVVNIDRGQKMVIFDSTALELLTPKALEFVYYHECGHFVLNHLGKKRTRADIIRTEHEADCFAVDYFAKKYDENELVRTLISLKSVNRDQHQQRIKTMLSCIGREYEN